MGSINPLYSANEIILLKQMGVKEIELNNPTIDLGKEWKTAKDIFDKLQKDPASFRKLFSSAKIFLKQENPRYSLIQLFKKRLNQIEATETVQTAEKLFKINTKVLVKHNPRILESLNLDKAQVLKIYKLFHTEKDLDAYAKSDAKKAKELVNLILRKHPELNEPKYLQGLKIAAFLVVYKASTDDLYDNYTMAQVFCINTTTLNNLELQFLKWLDFKLDFTK